MASLRHRRGLGTTAVVVLVFVGACSSGGATASSTSAASAAAAQRGPTAKECLEPMTVSAAQSFQLPPIVPCRQAHGGEIVTVYRLPGGNAAPYPAAGPSIAGDHTVATRCTGDATHLGAFGHFAGNDALAVSPALQQSTGVSQAWEVSGLQSAVYLPGTSAWAHGARWMACAVVLSNSVDVPSSYRGTARGARAKPGHLAEQFTWCKNQPDPNDTGDYETVSCAKTHNYEQLASFPAGAGATAFPGEPALDHLASQLCPALAAEATADRTANLPATRGISWTFPQQGDWANGSRLIRCFVVSPGGSMTGSMASG